MNIFFERVDDFHKSARLVMNDDRDLKNWRSVFPDPMPATHQFTYRWDGRELHVGPVEHPMDTVALVTDHFAALDDRWLRYLCEKHDIETTGITLDKEKGPKTLSEALISRLREKFPLPRGKTATAPPPPVQIQERVIVLPPGVAEMDIRTLEKEAFRNGGANAFKASQNKGASIAELRALVARLIERKRLTDRKQNNRAGLLV